MRWILPILLFVSAAPASGDPLPGDHLIVAGVRIGAADLAPADQGALTRTLGEPARTDRNGDHEVYHYGAEGSDQLTVDFDLVNDAPFEISTFSPAYRTRDGLGVGSSVDTIRARLGKPMCEGGSDTGAAVMAYDAIWFSLSRGAVTRVAIRARMAPGELGALRCLNE